MLRRNFLLVHNPRAGRNSHPLVARVVDALASRGATVTPLSSPPDEAIAADAIIVAGGDGSIRAAAIEHGSLGLPFGIVPVGTGNVLAGEIRMAREAAGIVDVLISGPTVAVEGAAANGAPFFLFAGVGFDGEVISRLDTRRKQAVGKLAYAGPIVAALREPTAELQLDIDGRRRQAHWAVVANARHYGGSFVMARGQAVDRPGLTAILFRGAGAGPRLRNLLAIALGRHEASSDVEAIPCHRVTISSARTVPLQLDGDPGGTTPVEIVSGGARLSLIAPAGYASR